MNAVLDHTHSLALYTYNKMSAMEHTSGNPLCKIYCKTDFKNKTQQGPIINFNLLRANGDFVGYSEVLVFFLQHNYKDKTCFTFVKALSVNFVIIIQRQRPVFFPNLLLPCNKEVQFSFSIRCCYWAH